MGKNWVDSISKEIDEQIELYISVRDYRFYQIDKLKRIAKQLDKEKQCIDCKYAKKELETLVSSLDRLINKSGVNKSEYEKRVEKLLLHLKKQHKVYQAYHFTYTYSAILTLLGVVFGLLLSYALFYRFQPTTFFVVAGLGMFIGNILGSRKDKDCFRKGKQI
jgi:hypothetical protein